MVEYRLWCEFPFDADELWIHRLLDYDWGRCLGSESSSCMGLGDRKLRFWIGIGHAGTLISAILFASSEMANFG